MAFYRKTSASYQRQNCAMTLREALDEFYSINAHKFGRPEPKTKWTKLLVHHDIGHVIFGVNTTLIDETAGDIWTLLATDMTFNEYRQYLKTPEAKELLKELGVANIIKATLCFVPLASKIYSRSRKMTKEWSFRDYEKYMDMPLGEIRESFNLRIL